MPGNSLELLVGIFISLQWLYLMHHLCILAILQNAQTAYVSYPILSHKVDWGSQNRCRGLLENISGGLQLSKKQMWIFFF